jgi:hypothetical protein
MDNQHATLAAISIPQVRSFDIGALDLIVW